MMIHQKLTAIFSVEKINIHIKQDISWLSIEHLLRGQRLEKYYLWLTTGKIIPEAGQVSPAIAHNGLMKII